MGGELMNARVLSTQFPAIGLTLDFDERLGPGRYGLAVSFNDGQMSTFVEVDSSGRGRHAGGCHREALISG